jgi:hypothetical protein
MTDFVPNFTKTYQIISASCKVLAKIDWSGNYIIDKISDEELQFLGEAKTPEQYFKRFIEIVKERVLKKLSDINYVKWHVKGFDETISLHYFAREVSKILEKYIKLELTKKYPQFVHHINNHKIDFNKTLIVEITNNDKTIFIANINVEHFI